MREKLAAERKAELASLPNPATPIEPGEIAGVLELAPPHVEPPSLPNPISGPVDRGMVDVKQAASMAGEPINAEALTEGQRQALDRLDDDRFARLGGMDPVRRAEILEPHKHGFNGHAFNVTRRLLDPPPRPRPDRVARTTPELIRLLAERDPSIVQAVAEALCRDFGTEKDRELWGAIHKMVQQAWRGEIPIDALLDAYGQAMGPKARKRGAVFTHALKAHGWRP